MEGIRIDQRSNLVSSIRETLQPDAEVGIEAESAMAMRTLSNVDQPCPDDNGLSSSRMSLAATRYLENHLKCESDLKYNIDKIKSRLRLNYRREL